MRDASASTGRRGSESVHVRVARRVKRRWRARCAARSARSMLVVAVRRGLYYRSSCRAQLELARARTAFRHTRRVLFSAWERYDGVNQSTSGWDPIVDPIAAMMISEGLELSSRVLRGPWLCVERGVIQTLSEIRF